MIMVDKLAYSSEIRYLNTGVKLIFALGTLLMVVGFRTPILSLVGLAIMIGFTLKFSNVSPKSYGKLMAGPLVFLILGTIVIAFDFSRAGITWTSKSLGEAGLLILISMSAVSCLYFLTLTTPTLDMVGVLKKIKCPWIVIELMVLIYRYIFVLLEIASAITTAQNCRLGNRNMSTSIKSMGQMLARLLALSLHKSRLLFDAMESRCYDGKLQVLFRDNPPKKKHLGGTIALLACLIALGTFEKGLWVL